MDEVKNLHSEEQIKMLWTCDVNDKREKPEKMIHTKMEGPRGRPRIRWIDQIRKDIEMRMENWEEILENRKWKN